MWQERETTIVTRDCDATQIPSGYKVTLPRGSNVTVTQVLGGNFTVMTDYGYLVRVADKDADALGEKYVATVKERAATPVPEGPFDENKIWDQLRTVYDPEIPVNIVDLGLVYLCQTSPLPDGGQRVEIQMSMTAPGCGMGDILKEDVRAKVLTVPGVKEADVQVVWDPPWDQSRMSEAARLQLGWM